MSAVEPDPKPMHTMTITDPAHQRIFGESRGGFYPAACEILQVYARRKAYFAGRAPPDVVQADYEQAIHELSVEFEIETGLL